MLSTNEKLEIMEKEMSVTWSELDSFLRETSGVHYSDIDTRSNWGGDWAENKYPLFLKFGNKLKLSKEVQNTMSALDVSESFQKNIIYDAESDIKDKMGKLFYELELDDLQNNKLSKDYNIDGEKLPKGMKVSKSLKFLFKDLDKIFLEKAQIKYSRFKEELEAKGSLEISIDPMDIICMSYNTSRDWTSCHNIFTGMYGAGPISYLVDGSTAIAQIVTHRSSKHSVPEKIWRRMLYFNDDLDVVFLSRHYPSVNKNNTNAVRDLFKETFGDTSYGMLDNEYSSKMIYQNTDTHYNDLTCGSNSKTAMIVLDKVKYEITHKDAEQETMREPYSNGLFDNVEFHVGSSTSMVVSASGYEISGEIREDDAIDGSEWGEDYYDEDDDDYYDDY